MAVPRRAVIKALEQVEFAKTVLALADLIMRDPLLSNARRNLQSADPLYVARRYLQKALTLLEDNAS